jgi:hypothetical protein
VGRRQRECAIGRRQVLRPGDPTEPAVDPDADTAAGAAPLWPIHDWDSLHDVFATTLGFFEFYGRNINALIDCLTYRDEDDGMASVTVESDDLLTLQFGAASAFARRCPDQYTALVQAG